MPYAALAAARGANSACRIRHAVDRDEWEAFCASLPAPQLTQSWGYGEAKAAEGWGVERLVFESDGQALAICQVLIKRVLGVAVAARINRGPQCLVPQATPEVLRPVHEALRQRWRFGRRGLLLLAPGLEDGEAQRSLMQQAGFRSRGVAGWCSAVLDLRLGEEALRARLAANWRNHLKVSERGGLLFDVSREADAREWMFARHAEHMAEKGFSGTSVSFLRALQRAVPEDFFVCRAVLDGQPVAGMVVVRFARSAEYFVGWYGPEARRSKAGNFLLWNAALAMRAQGCERFDLGGYSSSDGYGRFKQDMRGTEYRLLEEWMSF
ncbi:GNAT family N-acetyltransferase [Zoogloea sp.]|uniref:lipid II:glycine glycyltransferase FemX n=1 Tax=Zoogloea sp. TaxID=49181 RepID=UPI0014164D1E|nr:MAG: GNAT family N-acetyltransferase [Zoogloea sp.]